MSLGAFGGALGTAVVLIRPDTTQFSKDLQSQVTGAVNSVSKTQFTGLAGVGQSLFKPIVEGAAAAGIAAVDLGSKFDTARAGLKAVIADTGGSFATFQTQIEAADKSGIKFGLDQATVESGLTKLTAAIGDPIEAIQAYKAALDVTAATGDNFNRVVIDLERAANGQYAGLERLGVITAAQKDTVGSYGQALALIEQRYGGVAEAQANTFGGALKADRASIEDVIGSIGEGWIPKLTELAKDLSDVGQFLEQHKTLAEALGVAIGGPLVAALGAFVVAEARVATIGAIQTFKDLASGADTFLTKLGVLNPAIAAEAEEQQAQVSASERQAAALEELVAVQTQLVVPIEDTAVATQQMAAAMTEAVAAISGLSAASAETVADVDEMAAQVRDTSEAEAEWAEESIYVTETLSQLRSSIAQTDSALAEMDGSIAATRVDLDSLAEEETAASTEGEALNTTLAETGTASRVSASGIASLAGGLGVLVGAYAAGQQIQSSFNSDISKGAQSLLQSVQGISGYQAKLQALDADLEKAKNTHKSFLQELIPDKDSKGTPGGFLGDAIGDLFGSNQDINVKSAQQAITALKQEEQAQNELNAALKGGDPGAITNAENQLTAARKAADTATLKLKTDEDALTTAKANAQAASAKLAAEETTVAGVLTDTGAYAQSLTSAYISLAQSQESLAGAQQTLATDQTNFNQIMSDSGQYALTLADDENKVAEASTSLSDAQVKLAEAQQTWNDIQTDSGTYLEDQTKDTIAVSEAQLNATESTEALATAQNNLANLVTNSQAAVDALSEAHGNVALAQELANIQAGDATQNSTALTDAQNAVTKAELDQQTATLDLTDAQTTLNDLNNEAIPGTLQYQEQVVALQQAQQSVADATTSVANAQSTLSNQVAEATPGTAQYAAEVLQLAQDHTAVASATQQVSKDQTTLTNLIDEAIPGTTQYDKMMATLAQDQAKAASTANDVAKAQAAVATQIQATANAENNLTAANLANAQSLVTAAQKADQASKIQQGNVGTPGKPEARAGGGPIAPGQVYTVGENGPEVFVSNQAGNIIPNDALTVSGSGGLELNIANLANLDAIVSQWAAAESTLAAAYNNGPASASTGLTGTQLPVTVALNYYGSGGSADAQNLQAAVAQTTHDVLVPTLQGLLAAAGKS